MVNFFNTGDKREVEEDADGLIRKVEIKEKQGGGFKEG